MSTATDLLLTAKDNGLMLYPDGDNLRVRWEGVPPSPDLLANIKTHKLELIHLLVKNDNQPIASTADRYTHLTTCHQCRHLAITGHCSVKPQYKPLLEAMRDCVSFARVSGEREAIRDAPYSASELNDLLSRYEKTLFHHLVECRDCCLQDRRYCVDGYAVGSSYDAMLFIFNDAKAKREALLTQVIKARISGRRVFGDAK